MDIIERLNDPEMYMDAVDDAAREIEALRARVAELEAAQQSVQRTCAGALSGEHFFSHLGYCIHCRATR
jgi:uncharacterized protein YukE